MELCVFETRIRIFLNFLMSRQSRNISRSKGARNVSMWAYWHKVNSCSDAAWDSEPRQRKLPSQQINIHKHDSTAWTSSANDSFLHECSPRTFFFSARFSVAKNKLSTRDKVEINLNSTAVRCSNFLISSLAPCHSNLMSSDRAVARNSSTLSIKIVFRLWFDNYLWSRFASPVTLMKRNALQRFHFISLALIVTTVLLIKT